MSRWRSAAALAGGVAVLAAGAAAQRVALAGEQTAVSGGAQTEPTSRGARTEPTSRGARTEPTSGGAQAPAPAQPLAPGVQTLRLPSPMLELPVVSLGGSVETTADRITLQSDVLFAFGRARLGSAARSRVAAAVAAVRTHPRRALLVTGYTDAIGTDAANLVLSRRRAGAVARALRAALGSLVPSIEIAGRGEANPVASNTVDGRDDPRGRARNRRVELTFGT